METSVRFGTLAIFTVQGSTIHINMRLRQNPGRLIPSVSVLRDSSPVTTSSKNIMSGSVEASVPSRLWYANTACAELWQPARKSCGPSVVRPPCKGLANSHCLVRCLAYNPIGYTHLACLRLSNTCCSHDPSNPCLNVQFVTLLL